MQLKLLQSKSEHYRLLDLLVSCNHQSPLVALEPKIKSGSIHGGGEQLLTQPNGA